MAPDRRRARVWAVITRYLERVAPIKPEDRVLDLGSGYCDFINQVRARQRHARDYSPVVKEHAASEVSTSVGSCASLDGLKDGSFDVAFASNLLEHLTIEEIQATLRECLRVLAPGGRLVILQPNFAKCYKSFYDDYTHKSPLTDHSLRDLCLAAGLRVDVVKPGVLPFSFRSKLPAHPALVWLYLRSPFKPWAGQMLVVARKD